MAECANRCLCPGNSVYAKGVYHGSAVLVTAYMEFLVGGEVRSGFG
jgi:hypothetical protein